MQTSYISVSRTLSMEYLLKASLNTFLSNVHGFFKPFYSQYLLLISLKTSENQRFSKGFLMFPGGSKGNSGKTRVHVLLVIVASSCKHYLFSIFLLYCQISMMELFEPPTGQVLRNQACQSIRTSVISFSWVKILSLPFTGSNLKWNTLQFPVFLSKSHIWENCTLQVVR